MENKYNFIGVKSLAKTLPLSEVSIYQAINRMERDTGKKGKKIVFDDDLLKRLTFCFHLSLYDYLEFQEFKNSGKTN